MFVTELDTFLHKFHQLWSAGQSAHLDLETLAGNAWVSLRVQLQHPGHLHHQFRPPFPQYQKKQDSPSRQRRRARRTAARQADAARVSTEDTVEETVVSENYNTRNTEARNVEETENSLNDISESNDHFDS